MKTSEERIWILLSRKFSNSITDAEDAELKELLHHHPDAQYTIEILGKIWRPGKYSMSTDDSLSFNDLDDDKKSIQPGNTSKRNIGRFFIKKKRSLYYAAASLLLIMGTVICLWYAFREKPKPLTNNFTISTKAGEKKQINLPDGTKVWLNADSHLQYPAGFNSDSIRAVTLIGEAYFKVRHDEKHPFVIHTKNMEIRDIGTEFNVKSYPDEASAEATLISGIIEVSLHDNTRKVMLKPNEKIVVYQNKHFERYNLTDSMKKNAPVQDIRINGYRIATVEKDPLIQTFSETAWMQDNLVFKNESFEELARTMERKYAVKIIISDDHIRQYKLTGVFRDEAVEQALAELQVIAPFNYVIKDSVITISNK